MDNDFDSFVNRASELLESANKHGIKSVLVLYEDDPLTRDETKHISFYGGPVLAAGLAHYADRRILEGAGG